MSAYYTEGNAEKGQTSDKGKAQLYKMEGGMSRKDKECGMVGEIMGVFHIWLGLTWNTGWVMMISK